MHKPAQLTQNENVPGKEKAFGTLTNGPTAGSPVNEKTAAGSVPEAQPGAAGKTTGPGSVGVEEKGEESARNTKVEDTVPAPDPKADFRSALSKGKPILVYFYLRTCGECNRQKPVIEAVQAAYSGKVSFVYVDGDNDRGMEDAFNVELYPAIFLVERDRSTYSYTELKGFQTESMLSRGTEKPA
ncbi:MAG: Thioredoxin [Desulfotomaculum sp. 46_296]|nr:MAG: Thioredoxin [Desulfotomaculum sp. 46_296]